MTAAARPDLLPPTQIGDEVYVSVAADRAVTVHLEGQDVPPDTIALMAALGTTPEPWHDTVAILRAWSDHAPDLPAHRAVAFACLREDQRAFMAAELIAPDPLIALAVHDPGSEVRAAAATVVTAQPGMEDLARVLAGDENWWVRDRTAAGKALPDDVVDLLAADPSQDVQVRLLLHARTFSVTARRAIAAAPQRVRDEYDKATLGHG